VIRFLLLDIDFSKAFYWRFLYSGGYEGTYLSNLNFDVYRFFGVFISIFSYAPPI